MIDRKWALEFAASWIAAFNSHDLETIFSFYDDAFTMSSPYIQERMGVASGILEGKTQVRPYWEKSLAADPPVKFELIDVFTGGASIVICYKSIGRKVVCESLTFNKAGRITSGISQHGATLP